MVQQLRRSQLKIGARPNQVVLCVNLSEVTNLSTSEVMQLAESMGFEPELRYWEDQSCQTQLFAVLKDEQFEQAVNEDYLMDEWMSLQERMQPAEAVHLWRGVGANSIAEMTFPCNGVRRQ